MTPDLKTLLKGSTTWRADHRGVHLTLSHHGYCDGTPIGEYVPEPHPGTWCYYLHLTEQMFVAHDWSVLWLPDRQTEWGLTTDYHLLPELEFHGGCTFYEKSEQWDKHEKRLMGVIKVGCDYNHSWDRDNGYWQDFDAVLSDAKRSADTLLGYFPNVRARCTYSGLWDDQSQFYVARHGKLVHVSQLPKFSEEKWSSWLPSAGEAA